MRTSLPPGRAPGKWSGGGDGQAEYGQYCDDAISDYDEHQEPEQAMRLSARNKISATVTGITKGEATANVALDAKGLRQVASITVVAPEELGLTEGQRGYRHRQGVRRDMWQCPTSRAGPEADGHAQPVHPPSGGLALRRPLSCRSVTSSTTSR